MVKQLLEKLRRKLADNPDFHETMNFFMDVAHALPAFQREGERSPPDPKIRAALEASVGSLLKTKKFALLYDQDIRLPKYHFSHGPFLVSANGMGLYFYFHDSEQGMIMFNVPGQRTWCSRISAVPMPKGGFPNLKPYDKTPN
ncbi:MAG: hypothetical protein J5I98_23770 [Phaeodactylibacter sp.]|nr:hypothetical protein [Phaeodactylibacter sp.]